jgi:hypothetical protein
MRWLVTALGALFFCLNYNNAQTLPDSTQKQEEKVKQEQNPQEEDRFKEEIPEKLKYYKEKYELDIDAPFELVFRSIKKSISDLDCMIINESYSQTDSGLYKGSIRSDFCVFSQGSDSTYSVLKRYSLEMPTIRGGIWVNGRIQYKFNLREQKNGKVHILLKGELSGLESYVTNEVHFWNSSGYLETKMMESVKNNIDSLMTH